MRACVYCKTRYHKGSGITFHKFPTEDSTKHKWLSNMNVKSSIQDNNLLCSNHFREECFISHPTRRMLKRGCVPTIFLDSYADMTEKDKKSCVIKYDCLENRLNHPNLGKPVLDSDATTEKDNESCMIKYECLEKPLNHPHLRTPMLKIEVPLLDEENECSVIVKACEENPAADSNLETFAVLEPKTSYYGEHKLSQKIICKLIKHDHRYENIWTEPSWDNRQAIKRLQNSLTVSRTRVKALTQQVKRLNSKVKSLQKVVHRLKRMKVVMIERLMKS